MATLPKTPKKASKSSASSERTSVAVEPGVRKLLAIAAKETKHTHMEYVSAAIRYFAERGLDPVANHEREGAIIQKRIGDVEQLVVSLGNRLFGWLTQHEKNLNADLFGFLRGHEKTLFDYLQAQDKNVHEHLSDQEEMIFMPMIQALYATQVEALYGRRLGEQIFLRDINRDPFKTKEAKQAFNEDYSNRHQRFTERREEDSQEKFRNYVEKLAPAPQALPNKPQPTPLPQRTKTVPAAPQPPASEEPEWKF